MLRQLEIEPCDLGAYRLYGALQPKLCGYHLNKGWRIAFAFLERDPEGEENRVAIVYIGEKEPDDPQALGPMWPIVHEIFGLDPEPGSELRQPCCAEDRPTVTEEEVLDAMRRLRKLEKQARRNRRRSV